MDKIFSRYKYSRVPSKAGSTSSCLMFRTYPNLLKRETYPSAKLQKIFENRRNKGMEFETTLKICHAGFANSDLTPMEVVGY